MFSKRHYEFLVKFFGRELAFADSDPDATRELVVSGLARLLATELQNDSPRFNRDKFLKAIEDRKSRTLGNGTKPTAN